MKITRPYSSTYLHAPSSDVFESLTWTMFEHVVWYGAGSEKYMFFELGQLKASG